MDKERMSTTRILLYFSLFIALDGLLLGIFLVFKQWSLRGALFGGLTLFIFSFIALLVRMFANIGQMIFELRSEAGRSNIQLGSISDNLINLKNETVKCNAQIDLIINKIETNSQLINAKADHLNDKIDHINCDSKDMNQNINSIKIFFEHIEKNLDLKK